MPHLDSDHIHGHNETPATELNEAALKTFIMDYLLDVGVGVHMISEIARDLFGQHVTAGGTVPDDIAQTPKELYSAAVNDIVKAPGLFASPEFDLQTVIAGAPSLLFLVQYAHKVDKRVLPLDVIPSDLFVATAMHQFHANKQPALTSS